MSGQPSTRISKPSEPFRGTTTLNPKRERERSPTIRATSVPPVSPTLSNTPTIPYTINTANPIPEEEPQPSFFSSSLQTNYQIPKLAKELENYRKFPHDREPWPSKVHLAATPFHTLERASEEEKRLLRVKLNTAHGWWWKGEKIPKAYPSRWEWPTLPTELTDHLQYALIFDQVQGLGTNNKLEKSLFVNYKSHGEFLEKLNAFALQHKYTTTAPRPRWILPSHYQREGMEEETASRAALLYRAEAEMILYDLLNVGSQRTNQSLLDDLDILYRIRGPLWKESKGELDPETVKLNLIKKSTHPVPIGVVDIQPPPIHSQEFQDVAKDASKLPL